MERWGRRIGRGLGLCHVRQGEQAKSSPAHRYSQFGQKKCLTHPTPFSLQIYKYDEGAASDTVTVYGSFGGLLMALTGNYRHLSNVTIGNNVYLLLR